MRFDYLWIQDFIYVEVFLVIFLVVLAYLIKLLQISNDKNKDQLKKKLLSCMDDINVSIDFHSFLKERAILEILLQICHEKKSEASDQTKIDKLCVLLPLLARKKAYSTSWINRLLAAQAFQIYLEPEIDEKHVLFLLKDKMPIVHLYAMVAAIKLGSEAAINALIPFLAEKRRLAQTIYWDALSSLPPQSQSFVEQYLKKSSDPFVRATCYKILQKYPPFKPNFTMLQEDIHSTDQLELSLAAIRFFHHVYPKEEVIDVLTQLLSSPIWEVRVVSLQLLGKLQATSVLDGMRNALKDSVWHVRLNAALAIHNLPNGVDILSAQTPELDRFAYETAMHVLHKTAQPSLVQ